MCYTAPPFSHFALIKFFTRLPWPLFGLAVCLPPQSVSQVPKAGPDLGCRRVGCNPPHLISSTTHPPRELKLPDMMPACPLQQENRQTDSGVSGWWL